MNLREKIFCLEGKAACLSFRMVILMLIAFFTLYGRQTVAEMAILLGLMLASNIGIALVPERLFTRNLATALFLFDITMISIALYLSQGFESDLYLIYFLVVFMTIIARKPAVSFLVATLSCLLYGFLFSKTHAVSELLEPSILIRFPLLLIVAFFTAIIVGEVESEKEDLTERFMKSWMRSEKLIALGEMAAGIASELNNPIANILGTAQSLLSKGENVLVSSQDLAAIERNAARCSKIVGGLTRFAEEHEFHFEKVPLKKLVDGAVSLLRKPLDELGIRVKWKEEQGPVSVLASRPHLEQVVFNLLSNSLKAMPRGGTITFQCQKEEASNPRSIRIEMAVLTMQDTGDGIAQEDLNHLFEPFFSVRNGNHPGGMGLSVARRIIEKHRGSILVESRGLGKGTRIVICLPSASDTEKTAELRPFEFKKVA